MIIFLGGSGRKIKAYSAFLQQIMNQTQEIRAKKLKVSYTVIEKNAILVDCLMYTQILVDDSYDPMQISCPQCSHMDWDCDSLT